MGRSRSMASVSRRSEGTVVGDVEMMIQTTHWWLFWTRELNKINAYMCIQFTHKLIRLNSIESWADWAGELIFANEVDYTLQLCRGSWDVVGFSISSSWLKPFRSYSWLRWGCVAAARRVQGRQRGMWGKSEPRWWWISSLEVMRKLYSRSGLSCDA